MKRFSIVNNGYNIEEVNNFIDIVIKKLEQLSADNNNYLLQLETLKKRNTVVVNMKRVTPDQAKRIVDFLSGTVYALGGDLQKIGGGIFLCTPKDVDVEGAITDDDDKGKKNKSDIDFDW